MIELTPQQRETALKLQNGNILCAKPGDGKSRTALFYYFVQNGGWDDPFKMMENPKDLYIITTAKKRDDRDWEQELIPFLMHPEYKPYTNKIVVDSWNNIQKYKKVRDAFFIFDEQRVCGSGKWANTFIFLSKHNDWILLTGTPGDTWQDYIPVFIANGFYESRGEFKRNHCVFQPYIKYEKVIGYRGVGRLIRLRRKILVDMRNDRVTVQHHESVWCMYDILTYKALIRTRMNPETGRPFDNANELCIALRKVINKDEDRIRKCVDIVKRKRKAIIFYNFDYELDLITTWFKQNLSMYRVAQWNGHRHETIPESERWIYLVQYNAGAEGWNCIETDTIIFFSQSYSYKAMAQASGRIDRLNTSFVDLWYYHLKCHAGIDLAIDETLKRKEEFNEGKFVSSLN